MKKGQSDMTWGKILSVSLGLFLLVVIILGVPQTLIAKYRDAGDIVDNSKLGDEIRLIGLNPPDAFSDKVTIKYELISLLDKTDFSLKVYNYNQELKVTIEFKDQRPGERTIEWDGMNEKGDELEPGTYYLILAVGSKETDLEEGEIQKLS
ncbi:hypothetical protein HQ533_01405 [Candidatus Woesearchaeota archaeon]|nr:hypothetical protein [Candidatus Woesearchaeota archaeon]